MLKRKCNTDGCEVLTKKSKNSPPTDDIMHDLLKVNIDKYNENMTIYKNKVLKNKIKILEENLKNNQKKTDILESKCEKLENKINVLEQNNNAKDEEYKPILGLYCTPLRVT